MSFNLIPFGYHIDTGEYLDVSDVPNGKNNGCICPSCDTPLVARQGKINHWHFAHANRKVYKKTTQRCEYSFFVSVRMMVRQLIAKSLSMSLPAYQSILEVPLSVGDQLITIPFAIAQESNVNITNIEVEKNVDNVVFDFCGSVGNFRFLVFLSHKGRGLSDKINPKSQSDIAVIEISLNGIGEVLFQQPEEKRTYKHILLDFIKSDVTFKKWISHPRYTKARNKAVQSLNAFKQQFSVNGVIHDKDIDTFFNSQLSSKS